MPGIASRSSAQSSMHPGQDERLPSLTTSGTITDGDVSDQAAEDEEELKNEMKLLWAERENIDLKLKLHRVEVENRGLRVKATELQASTAATKASMVQDTVALAKRHDELVKAVEEKQLELSMHQLSLTTAEEATEEASRMRIYTQNLQAMNERLTNELDNMRLKLGKAMARANDTSDSRSLVVELQAKIENLADKNDQLTAKHFASSETVKKNTAELEFYRAKNENNKHEVMILREKLAAAETDRDW